jgi:hypothetical protein
LNIVSDLKLPNDGDTRFGVGMEYWLGNVLAGRLGYNSYYKFCMGIGLSLENMSADYAYMPLGELGITNRISVGYKFDADFFKAKNSRGVIVEPVVEPEPFAEDNKTEDSQIVNEYIQSLNPSPASDNSQAAVISSPATENTAVTENLLEQIDF